MAILPMGVDSGFANENDVALLEVGEAVDILRVVLGNNEDGNVLDQLKLVVHVAGDRLELLDGASDKEVALFGGGDLGLDLGGVGEGHVHGAAGLLLEGLGDLREGSVMPAPQ